MKNIPENILDKYLYDINIIDELYITLDMNKIKTNGNNYRKYTDVCEFDHINYCLVVYYFGSNTVLTFLDNGKYLHSQFLITSDEIIDNLRIEELTPYVGYFLAEMVINYFK